MEVWAVADPGLCGVVGAVARAVANSDVRADSSVRTEVDIGVCEREVGMCMREAEYVDAALVVVDSSVWASAEIARGVRTADVELDVCAASESAILAAAAVERTELEREAGAATGWETCTATDMGDGVAAALDRRHRMYFSCRSTFSFRSSHTVICANSSL